MKLPQEWFRWERVQAGLKHYAPVLLVIAVGAALLLWPSGEDGAHQGEAAAGEGQAEAFSVRELEERLEQVLSKIQGAGEVSVVLTVNSDMERVWAVDQASSEEGGERQSEVVVISTGSGEEPVLVTRRYPTFQGALVVCAGGENPMVQLLITKAVAALTGLGTDRITVCQGS